MKQPAPIPSPTPNNPTPTATPVASSAGPLPPTPTPQIPTELPNSGGQPLEQRDSPWRYLLIGGGVLVLSGVYLALRSWRGVR
ncbi:MAG: hypothetical protein Q8O75_02485 [bacterium]|nr:hypothetical protein [bacterium]